MKLASVMLLIGGIALLVAACTTDGEEVPEPPRQAAGPTPARAELRADEFPLLKGPVSPDGLQAIFGTPDLGVGEQRVGFVLTSPTGLVRSPAATVSSLFFPTEGSAGELKETALAVFRLWPYGTRGLYTTSLTFDRPGSWGIDIDVVDTDGSRQSAELRFEVGETPSAPSVGSPAFRSRNKTLADVDSLAELTTGSLQDADLYRLTLAEAAANGMPTVVVMASPAFCTNAVCGPQVEVLQQLKDAYKGRANFVHVDFYDNPQEIQGDLSRARISPTVLEWGLPSTEWSFVIDRRGIVSDRFESFATLEELEQALLKVL